MSDFIRTRLAGAQSGAWGSEDSFEESVRVLRSNLEAALSDIERTVVIVTSSKEDEGKTTVCAKLAISFAQAGRRVVLVDLDFRVPTAHRLLKVHNEFGMSDVLLGQRTLQESLQQVEIPSGDPRGTTSLYFVGTGPTPSNPTELLASGRTARAIDALSKQADLVLLDAPPVIPVADTLVIGRMASGALLVVQSRSTTLPAVQQCKDRLIRNQTRLLGVVLNKVPSRPGDLWYGYGHEDAPAGRPAAATSNGWSGI